MNVILIIIGLAIVAILLDAVTEIRHIRREICEWFTLGPRHKP